MKEISYSSFKANLEKYLDSVIASSEMMIVSQNSSKEQHAVVTMSLSESNSLQETNYLLSTSANKDRLMKSLAQAEAGEIKEVDLDKLLN